MGYAKYDEDIRETVSDRIRESGKTYCGDTRFNPYPSYPSRNTSVYSQAYTSTYNPTYTPYQHTSTAKIITPIFKPKPKAKPKIGYIERNYEHDGIEIYFYHIPSEEIREELKDNYWHWHKQKKCWFRKYSSANQRFAESIIEQ